MPCAVGVSPFVDMSEKQQDFIARTTSILRNALTELESSAVSNANVTQGLLPSNSPSKRGRKGVSRET